MNRYFFLTVFLFCQCIVSYNAYTQTVSQSRNNPYLYDFVPGENVVFYDDFTGYKEGTFPSRWELQNEPPENHYEPKTVGVVTKMDSVWCLYFKQGNGAFAIPLWDTANYTSSYNNGSTWTFEFDFRFFIRRNNSENVIGINVSTASPYHWCYFDFGRYQDESNIETFEMLAADSLWRIRRATYPAKFNKNIWHHFAISLTNDSMRGYIDHCKLFNLHIVPNYHLPDLQVRGRAEVAIKNFRLAYTDPINSKKKTPDALFTEKKFTTHAINFDKNKAIIKQESMSFIQQMAGFLKANPSIKLEIDGHTDNDGTADANMILSKNRAEAIKKKLVSLGINAKRIQTKGFGATTPINTNATEDGKAQNRRVEFIKL